MKKTRDLSWRKSSSHPKMKTSSDPDWLGKEVTGDRRYYNSMLMKHPYRTWKEQV